MHVSKTPHHTQIVERSMYNTGLPAERAILCKEVARLHGEGMSIATACAKVGLGMRSWYRYVEEYARVDMWYKQALRRRADAVAQSVFELATGKAMKKKTVYGFEEGSPNRILQNEIEEIQPPDTAAAKYYLNNVAPSEWREKVDVQHSGEVKYEPLSITVKPVTIDVEATDAETVPKKGTVIDL